MPLTHTRVFRLGGGLLIAAFALLYLATLDTGLQPHELHGGDLITHQYAQVQARPSNAPGYPLYTAGGWFWFHTLRGLTSLLAPTPPNPIPLLSSYSTLWALLALGLLYVIFGRLLVDVAHPGIAALLAWLTVAFFGVTYFFWYYATTTEQYSSAVAQTLAIIYTYLRWDEQPAARGRLYALAFLCGLSLAHMLTVAFIVPPLVLMVILRDPSLLRSLRAIVAAVAAALAPLLAYVYVYMRGALNPQWWGQGDWASPQAWFWAFISTAQGREELGWAFEPGRTFFGNGFPELIAQELSIPILLLGLLGLRWLPRRLSLTVIGTLLIYLAFCWAYRFGNWFQVILPAYPLILLGLAPVYRTLLGLPTHRPSHWRAAGIVSLVIIALLWRITASLPAADSRHRVGDTALDHAARLLDQPLPPNTALFATVDDALALTYLTQIWGIRPDVTLVSQPQADDLLAAGRPLLATVDAAPLLLSELRAQPWPNGLTADWLLLAPTPPTTTFSPTEPRAVITPDILLVALTAAPTPTGAPLNPALPPGLDVTITWYLPNGAWPDQHAISLRPLAGGAPLTAADGAAIQSDRSRPVHTLWRDADRPALVTDTYRLPTPSPADALLLILYTTTPAGFVNLAELTFPLAAVTNAP